MQRSVRKWISVPVNCYKITASAGFAEIPKECQNDIWNAGMLVHQKQTNRQRRPVSPVSDAACNLKLDTGVMPEVAFNQSASRILGTRQMGQLLNTNWKVL